MRAMSPRPREELLREIEAVFRARLAGAPPEKVDRWVEFELRSVDIHRENLVPFVRGHGVGAGHHLLDFGSGPGCSACALALELGARVTGVEPNRGNEQVAPLWLDYCGVGELVELHFLDDTTSLPFASGTFDFVLASSVLEYIPGDRGPYLREMWRVLRPGGRLLIAGTSNAAWPREVHSHTWLVNWMPNLGPRIRAAMGRSPSVERGITFGELAASLPGARFVRGTSGELEAFAARAGGRATFLPSGVRRGLTSGVAAALEAVDRRTTRAFEWPAEAFLPWLNVAFERPG